MKIKVGYFNIDLPHHVLLSKAHAIENESTLKRLEVFSSHPTPFFTFPILLCISFEVIEINFSKEINTKE